MEWISLFLFLSVIVLLLAGFPVAFSLGGTALLFAFVGVIGGGFEAPFLSALPSRIFGIMNNEMLVAVPLFVFMGVTLERAHIAEELLETLSSLFGSIERRPGDFGDARRHAACRKHGHRRRDRGDNGPALVADDVETRLLR